MEYLAPTLVIAQVTGALVGFMSAVWSELAYVHARRDGRLSHSERAHIRAIEQGLRYGLLVVLLASLGLVVVAYVRGLGTPPAFTEAYWVLALLSIVVLGLSGVVRRGTAFNYGSGTLLAAWWCLLLLSMGALPVVTVSGTLIYLLVTACVLSLLVLGGRRLVACV